MPVVVEGITAPQLGVKLGAWVQQQTIAIAERELAKEVARGFDASPVVITDGTPRRDYRRVKPFGKIEFARRQSVLDAVLWAIDRLREVSPIGPPEHGHYRDDHVVMINGQQITGDLRAALTSVRPGQDRVQIVNTRPYARKIEGATASGARSARRPLSRQAPGGVYRKVQRELLQRFGRVMFFDYTMVKLNLGVKVWGAVGGGRRKVNGKWVSQKPRERALRDQVYPALQFFLKD